MSYREVFVLIMCGVLIFLLRHWGLREDKA